MDLDRLFLIQAVDTQIYPSGQNVEPGPVVAAPGKVGKLNLGLPVEPEKVLPAEIDFRPPLAGADLVALDERQVDGRFLGPEVAGSGDGHVTLDIGHAGEARAIIILALG